GPFAYGVAGQAAPFGEDLTGTVRDSAGPLAGNAATGVQGVAHSVTPGYAQDLGNQFRHDLGQDAGAYRV
ncbi:hypothetical protein ACFU7X_27695, partial [Streptomyces chartreusis]